MEVTPLGKWTRNLWSCILLIMYSDKESFVDLKNKVQLLGIDEEIEPGCKQ